MPRAKKTAETEAAKPQATQVSEISIEQPRSYTVALEVAGPALIQNAFSQKAIEQMLRKHMGLTTQREKKVPRQCIEDATIRNTKGDVCIPVAAFKKGMLTASTLVKGLKKTHLRIALYVVGKSIPITYEATVPRMDMVRTSGISRAPDVRFRPMFENWKARLVLQHSDAIPVQTVVDLLNRAGQVGVCEWRPEKDGTFGTYKVVRHISAKKEIAEVMDACATPLTPLIIPPWAMDQEMEPEIMAKISGSAASHESPDEDEELHETPPEEEGNVA